MKATWKKTLALCLAMILCLSLAACSSGTQDGSGGSDGTTTEGSGEGTTGAAQAGVTSGEWKEKPEAYLSGIKALEYVTLPEDYLTQQYEVEKAAEVTDEDVQNMIDNLRSVGDEVHDGDTVNINYIGMMDGEQFQGGTANGQYLTIGSGQYIDGFESGLIGAKKDETVTLDISFPDPYTPNPDYSGKPVQFIVTINAIYLAELPELTDKYVADQGLHDDFGKAITNVEDYRAFVRSYLEKQSEDDYNNSIYSKIMAYLAANSTFAEELPQPMVDRYTEELVSEMTEQALSYGTDLKSLMASYGLGEEEYLEYLREQAGEQVKYLLALGAIAETEDLLISDERLDSELADLLMRDGMAEQGYTSMDSYTHDERESYREYMMRMDVLEFLKKHANITETVPEETESSEETTGN